MIDSILQKQILYTHIYEYYLDVTENIIVAVSFECTDWLLISVVVVGTLLKYSLYDAPMNNPYWRKMFAILKKTNVKLNDCMNRLLNNNTQQESIATSNPRTCKIFNWLHSCFWRPRNSSILLLAPKKSLLSMRAFTGNRLHTTQVEKIHRYC